MNVGSLFSGVGGIDLGLERAGMRVAWQCEIDPWCRGILARHWPDVPQYGDIRTIDADTPRVDVLAGGFPCQPVSLAGKGLAQADHRWLWPEFARCIRVLRPRYVIAENVPGLLTRGLDLVLADLAALGFDAEWTVFGARDVGAPHKRDRVWIVAWDPNANRDGLEGRTEPHERTAGGLEAPLGRDANGLRVALPDSERQLVRDEPGRLGGTRRASTPVTRDDGATRTPADASRARLEGQDERRQEHAGATGHGFWAAESDVGRSTDGISAWLDGWEDGIHRVATNVPQRVHRLKALGNAVVPQCAEHIGRLVMEMAAC